MGVDRLLTRNRNLIVSRSFQRNVLPDAEQSLLLKACLLRDPESANHARIQWQKVSDLDDLDHGSFQLIPLLWKRSIETGWDLGVDKGRIQGIYRYSWSRYQLLNRAASRILNALIDARVPVTMLKGGALSQLVYEDPVCRPFNDIDILVPGDFFEAAVRVLESKDWTTLQTGLENAQKTLHAIGFQSPDRFEVDLHRHVLESKATNEITSGMLSRVQAFERNALTLTTLSFEDHFIHACAHGAVYSPWPQIRWLADTDRILRHCQSEFDWERALSTAEAADCIIAFRETVHWLKRELEHSVPEARTKELDAMKPAPTERLLFHITSLKTPKHPKFRHRLPANILHFHRQSPFRWSSDWVTDLKRHLMAANNFDRSAHDLFRDWLYKVVFKFRNFQYGYFPLWASGLKNWRIHRDSISRTKESELFGFHLIECDAENRLLRWSTTKAGLLVRDRGGDLILEIETLNCRPELLRDHLVDFSLNGVELPKSVISLRDDGIIVIEVKRPYRSETGDSWLTWEVPRWEIPCEDPRELGIPVYSVRHELVE